MCPSRRCVQCIIARADATVDEEAGVARPDGIPLAVVSCVRQRRRIRGEVASKKHEFPREECRSCIAVDSRNRQAGDPGDVPAAHGGADSRQADVLLRAPCRHGHGHRGRGATSLALSFLDSLREILFLPIFDVFLDYKRVLRIATRRSRCSKLRS